MRAISNEAIAYVCEMDRDEKPEYKTVFWIRPKTYREVNRAMKRYGRTFTEDGKGFKDYDNHRLNTADQSEWTDVVVKIENFAFDKKYYDAHPDVKEQANKDGFIKVIEADHLKTDVLDSLSANIVNEIWRASADISMLRDGEKNV